MRPDALAWPAAPSYADRLRHDAACYAFESCLIAGYEYDVIADVLWAMVESGHEPTMEVLTFLAPTTDGSRIATNEVFSNFAIGEESAWVLWGLVEVALLADRGDPIRWRGFDARRIAPAYLAVVPPDLRWRWTEIDRGPLYNRRVRRPGRHKPSSLRLWEAHQAGLKEYPGDPSVERWIL